MVEGGVEIGFLFSRKVEGDVSGSLEDVEEVLVFFTQVLEVILEGLITGVRKDVVPYEFCIQVVERES